MSTIRVDTDAAEAVKDGRMTHAEAWQLTELRRRMRALSRQMCAYEDKLRPLEDEFSALDAVAKGLLEKLNAEPS